MIKMTTYVLAFVIALLSTGALQAQENNQQEKIKVLEQQREQILQQEKAALKKEVEAIELRMEKGELSAEEAQSLKEAAAKKHALNIEDRTAIVDSRIALIQRNGIEVDSLADNGYSTTLVLGMGQKDADDEHIFGLKIKNTDSRLDRKYDRRTYSDPVIAFGLNNALIDGQSIDDSPYKIGGSRFFELGWQWRTRVFKNTNFLRFNYGVSLQFNGLKPKDNQYFVVNGDQTELETFEYELDKSKFRMDNLVVPLYLEFGPSRMQKTDERIRYSLNDQFRFGIGGFGGFNLGARQKLKYDRDGDSVKDKLKRSYNVPNLVYGLAAYIGVEDVLLYVKYDLNPIFKDAAVEQHNISLGLRFDM